VNGAEIVYLSLKEEAVRGYAIAAREAGKHIRVFERSLRVPGARASLWVAVSYPKAEDAQTPLPLNTPVE
jgi:hypothetical protein